MSNMIGGGPLLQPDHKSFGGARQQSNDGDDAHKYLWAGSIMHVDVETMVCSVRLESGEGERHDIPLPSPGGSGPRSWSGSIPEIGTKVLLGWKKYSARGTHKPYIVEFVTTGIFPSREFEPFSVADPDDIQAALNLAPDLKNVAGLQLDIVRMKMRKAYSGDYLASSSGGSDILLDRDALLTNRAGNELRLRDSDQTTVLQTVNEFSSNAAGYYRRGLIKRNAFNILPDVFGPQVTKPPKGTDVSYFGSGINTTISPDSPAFSILFDQGLISVDENGNGVPNFPTDPNAPGWHGYPYVVMPDGHRVSYIVTDEHATSFAETELCYIEDRVELRHASDGVMAVTEDGDGFQVDKVHPVFIEDVKGTVVGNDPTSEGGRQLYKQILKMNLFDYPEQSNPAGGPRFSAVDMVSNPHESDTLALARLFRVKSPTSGNEYAFGITKEGRIFCHIPKSLDGTPQEAGKSVDLNVAGLIKAIIGSDPNTHNTSLDLRMQGGLAIDIGRFDDGRSIHAKLAGKVKVEYNGNDANGLAKETIIGGQSFESVSASKTVVTGGAYYESVGGAKVIEATGISINAGAGGYKVKSAWDYGLTVLGKSTIQYAQIVNDIRALGTLKITIAGLDSSTVLAGSIMRTVVAGAGIVDTVTAGNYVSTVATGNYLINVGAGNCGVTVGAGNLSLSCGGGPASITSGTIANITAAVSANLQAPIVKIGVAVVGGVVAGIPAAPAPHLDYVTGIAILGISTKPIG